MEKYVGLTVDIIYEGCDGKITQRRIEVREVQDGIVKAYCLQRRAPRVFKLDNTLAVQVVIRNAG